MITRRKGFNEGADDKVIDLDYYRNNFVKPSDHVVQNGASFVRFDWLSLDKLDTSSKDFANHNVRAEGTSEDRVAALQNEFSKNGWDCTKYPPIVDTSGQVRDGRTRAIAAKRNREQAIPVAVYSYSSNSVAANAANGIIANVRHQPQDRPTPADFIAAARAAHSAGDIKGDKVSIERYLINDCKIDNVWSLGTAIISRIVNDVLRDIHAGNKSLVIKDTNAWRAWAQKVSADQDLVVLKAGNGGMPRQAWCDHVLSRVDRGENPPKFVFYTDNPNPKQALKDMRALEKKLDKFYVTQYKMFTKDFLKNTSSVKTPAEKRNILKNKTFSVLGAVPQFSDYHDLDSSEIIPLDEYLG